MAFQAVAFRALVLVALASVEMETVAFQELNQVEEEMAFLALDRALDLALEMEAFQLEVSCALEGEDKA